MQLNYKTFGHGEPLIILHGMFGMLDNWQRFANEISNDFSVFIVDQRNHGRSPHFDAFNYEVMAEDLFEFMHEHYMFEAFILGHSMGGKTAMQMALMEPDMVPKLIVVDIAPKPYGPHHHAVLKALSSVPIEEVTSRNQVRDILMEHIQDEGVRQFLMKNLSRKKSGGYKWKMNLDAVFMHYDKILDFNPMEDPFENPTLFVRGGKSEYIVEEDEPIIKKQFLNARIETIEKSGHWVHVDAYDELMTLSRDFLNEL
jgi:pimeloyl-ACP methyl ester carboxylesterase